MSLFTDLRTYFDTKIKLVDADLNVFDDAFGDQPLNNVYADKFYKLVIGPAVLSNNGNTYIEEYLIQLIVFEQRKRSEIDTFNNLYDKVIQIKDLLVAPCDVKSQNLFSDMLALTVTPEKQNEDDKTFSMTLEFNLRVDKHYN